MTAKIQTLMEEKDPQAAGRTLLQQFFVGYFTSGACRSVAAVVQSLLIGLIQTLPVSDLKTGINILPATPVKIVPLEGTVPPYLVGEMAILDNPGVTKMLRFDKAQWVDMFQASGGTIGSGGTKG